ncbi:hypothetical protein OESDEN_10773 [Oesophagostomum dentatum]|uniref:Uncharacterized protein n=1 Tax=Oesophagostomum dentatum TaxID=61180 RepID=A0A0B1SZQ1_OESDE|nr:hypothetical protein OESDEN_10773 [Oesophagostomum dentatum]
MKILVLLIAVGTAICALVPTPKMILTRKIAQHITGFLSDEQLSKAIDITALGIHNGKGPEEIMSDIYDYFLTALDDVQLKALTNAYKALVKVRAEGDTPDLAYFSMSRQLTQNFVKVVTGLVKDTLTPAEWNSVRAHYGIILRILDLQQQPCIPVTTITGTGVTSTTSAATSNTGTTASNPNEISASAAATSPNVATGPNAIGGESNVGVIPDSVANF